LTQIEVPDDDVDTGNGSDNPQDSGTDETWVVEGDFPIVVDVEEDASN